MKQIQLTAQIPARLHGQRLDKALAALFPDYSRSQLKQWIEAGSIKIEDKIKRPREKVSEFETVSLNVSLVEREKCLAQPIDLEIVYEDDALIVINKPPGLVVHPGAGNADGTLVNALLHHCPSLNLLPRAGLIHRIDKNTSGLLLIAKTLPAHTRLVADLQARNIHRRYLAIVQGTLTGGGTVDKPIARHPTLRIKMAIVPAGKPAVTHYRVKERFANHTLIDVTLETGRTHQIRVHMASIHYPILGDPAYGARLSLPKGATEDLKTGLRRFKRQALHAAQLKLMHPVTDKSLTFEAPPPARYSVTTQLAA